MKMRYRFPDMGEQDSLVSDEKVKQVGEALRACRDAREHQWPSRLSGEAFLRAHMLAEACTVCGTIRSVA